MRRLPRSFFARDTRIVAHALLGKVLVHILEDGTRLSGHIIETEAYRQDDMAAHSYRGRTPRTAPMFGKAGVAYVYFTYGMHHCINVVAEEAGVGAAVLIRALEPLDGVEVMQHHRQTLKVTDLCRGPGNVCKAFALDRTWSGYDMQQHDSLLFIADDGAVAQPIQMSPRIGVSGDALAKTVLWRFYIAGNPCVSGSKLMRL